MAHSAEVHALHVGVLGSIPSTAWTLKHHIE